MPLNRTTGERLGDLGPVYRVVPAAKWRDLPGVRAEYELVRAGKWPAKRTRPIYEDYVVTAQATFVAAGALMPVWIPSESILVQEYPLSGRVAFAAARDVMGREQIVWRYYDLSPGVVAWLAATGRWQKHVQH